MNTTCVIGARGGSKGVANKNIRPLLGKPLIAWTIEQALACPEIDRLVISTDSPAIAEVARAYGAEVPFMRPAELASDTAGKWEVWQHALAACEAHYGETIDLFVDMDCTSPLRDVDDISKAIAQFRASDVDAVFSVCEARKNPYFNMLEVVDGVQRICKQLPKPIVRRQDAPKVFEHVASIYVLSPDYLRRGTGLLSGRTHGYDIGTAKSPDIDSEFDFELVEYLMKKRLSL
ncbi:MAG: acylneuraminate cytidylyltransferase family protein [Hydrogenophaga sp.]|jgi:CMP-N-acetylneuraminic acid synthetase|uniref:acylneuraminate cytidylyltransferase family protein n=1 Tax=Hydrogenophaga sp. TaxID=1904254 RepID=UPI00271AD2D0|nr:acylneuraminate cytidylyltransferase family protein [Hydrogenophaga sp.]MDO9203324.1 acylneuraminate cytidylyltransferase family protein [Hydrogenophaga sp.]MDO9568515.1 acylneuraminate cytidylyltransferase family protein [Hydrogenophaga sp.]MDP1894026.1 acylneuraminate cytidylyltransferase family protein [Hydrogenophaga sp.]MDP3376265.1 acylneuraminate cytidylyltransferase family protein [Hydrogenophaga sp.]MDP3924629.1 acylneuraminate cytidylyltransferase family protein [Hydrogenophaga sp